MMFTAVQILYEELPFGLDLIVDAILAILFRDRP